jgi:hypothetical protein
MRSETFRTFDPIQANMFLIPVMPCRGMCSVVHRKGKAWTTRKALHEVFLLLLLLVIDSRLLPLPQQNLRSTRPSFQKMKTTSAARTIPRYVFLQSTAGRLGSVPG